MREEERRMELKQCLDSRILLLDGRIDAQGSHEELLRSSSRYRRMAELQMGGAAG